MTKKLQVTEEFLWRLYEFLEAINDAQSMVAFWSFHDVANPEMRKLRLAYEKKKQAKSFSQFISSLRQRGYIKIPSAQGVGTLQLTEKGKRRALAAQLKSKKLPDPSDGKMIMLMYDIPKEKQRVRNIFRARLEYLGYHMLQKSVLISSKDVLEETNLAIREFHLEPCVQLFVIEKIRVHK